MKRHKPLILWIILIIFSANLFAGEFAEGDGKTIQLADDKEITEGTSHLTMIKEKQVGKLISNSSFYKGCTDKFSNLQGDTRKKEIRKCFMQDIDQLSDEQLNELSSGLKLEEFGITTNKESAQIKDFIGKRLNKILYGVEDPDKKGLMELKQVSHDTFNKIHASNLTKSFYRDTFDYCMNYVKFKDNCNASAPILSWSGRINKSLRESLDNKSSPVPTTSTVVNDNSEALTTCLDVGPQKTRAELELDEKIKITEISNPELEKHKFNLCLSSAQIFCNTYEEKIKNLTKTSDNYKSKTQSEINKEYLSSGGTKSDLSIETDKDIFQGKCDDQTGKVCAEQNYATSCLIVKRMRNYRNTLAETAKNEERWKELRGTKGYNTSFVEAGFYTGKADGEKIDDITTITSENIRENFDDKDLKEAKDKCKNNLNAPECETLFREISSKENDDLLLAHEAQTQIIARKIDSIEDKDELIEFAKSNGYHNIVNEVDAELEVLRAKLREKFKAERYALVQEFNKKLQDMSVKKDANSKAEKDQDIKDTFENVTEAAENKKEKLEKLYHYSNIVMGYMEVEENGERKQFTSIRDAELSQSNAKDNYAKKVRDADKSDGKSPASSGANSTIILSGEQIDKYFTGETKKTPPKN